MKRSGSTDLPLHGGRVPAWLSIRMALLGRAMTEAIVLEYGRDEFLKKLSDPFWFQSFGCVLGMDWHSSGITTSVMGALKKALSPIQDELGIYVCGGRGKQSLKTPEELLNLGYTRGLDADSLIRTSKLTAKVDSSAVQDGFNLYLHSFVAARDGKWVVIQQGMNDDTRTARRYHWSSYDLQSFVNDPHTGVAGPSQGDILNLVSKDAQSTREGILNISKESAVKTMHEVRKMSMPHHHDVKGKDVNIKRLGAVLAMTEHREGLDFEQLLLMKGVGARTLQSLTLVSEVIHGTPSRFEDPARFSYAHGGKDGHPFPVPTRVYDQTIEMLSVAVDKAKVEGKEKLKAIKRLHENASRLEKDFNPVDNWEKLVERERRDSWKYGGKTVMGDALPPMGLREGRQLDLFLDQR